MKKFNSYRLIVGLVIIGLSLNSCEADLDTESKDKITELDLLNDPANAIQLANGVYNKNLAPIPTNGYYKYDQEIKLLDSVAPVLIVIPDITTDIFSANCSMELVNIPSTSATDCGALLTSGYRFEIDLYNDGIIDRKGLGNNASGLFPTGEHRIYYFAKDLCNKEGFSFFKL